MNPPRLRSPQASPRPASCRLPVGVVALCLLLSLGGIARSQIGGIHEYIDSYEGARTCTECHPEKPAEVAASLHYQHQAPALNVPGSETNSLGMLTEYCGLPASVAAINWIGLLQPTNSSLPAQPGGCARCHAGNGIKPGPVGTLTQTDFDSVDCLVCHAPDYSRTVVNLGGTLVVGAALGVDTTVLAKQVQRPTTEMCLRCHLSAGGGPNFKHGVVPTVETDVHLAAGLECVDCHSSSAHRIAGAGDLKAVDAPDIRVDCANCHTAAPHQGAAAIYNSHTARVACQTCHIPLIARSPSIPTVLERDWTQPVQNPTTGLFDPKNLLATNVTPAYRWWNRKLKKYPPGPLGSITDADAKIYPWKHITAYVPADAVSGALLPLKAGIYSTKGDLSLAVAAGARQTGLAYSGSWKKVADELTFEISHQVAPKAQALHCADCHASQGGRLDFAALGYDSNRVAFLQSAAPLRSHTGRLGTNYLGAGSCLSCHPAKAEEVMDTVHYTWRTTNSHLAYPGGGSHGMLDRFCGLVGASSMVNYFADLGGHKSSSACGKCHVADSLPFPNPATGQYTPAQINGLDCLICHASAGNYDMNGDNSYDAADADASHRLLTTNSLSGRRAWFQDRSLRAAESVGQPVTAAQCLRCHEHGQAAADYKRGTPFDPEHDVHAAAGLNCTACHKVDHHKIARGSHVTDMHAWERQDVEVACANCHGTTPHTNPAMPELNQHTALIACETCHIPWTSGALRRVWGPTFGITNGPEAQVPAFDPATGTYEPYSTYSGSYNLRPVYRWYNGNESMLAEPIHDVNAWDSQIATKSSPGARIFPFRAIVNGMIMDRRGFGYDPNFNTNFTMLAALDAMAGPLKQMGFMRPTGLTPQERGAMAQYPNLLNFDEETYFHSGNIRESVNIGLGKLGLMMSGQDAVGVPPETLSAIGANFWSGDVLGLDLPNNPMDPLFNPAAPPTEVTGSFISLSHAVKRNGALSCQDCHSPAGVMDFRALNYSAAEIALLQTPVQNAPSISVQSATEGLKLRWYAVPGRTYQVQGTTNLSNGTWLPIGPALSATNQWLEKVLPTTEVSAQQQMFFRVMTTAR